MNEKEKEDDTLPFPLYCPWCGEGVEYSETYCDDCESQ